MNEKKDHESHVSSFKERTGIEPKELIKAPIEPPKIKDKKPPTTEQKSRFAAGIIILLIGIMCVLVNAYLSVVISLIGVGVTVWAVMIRPASRT